MASNDSKPKQGYLRLLDDGTVDRTWTGPPEVLFLMSPVPPNGTTVHDLPTNPPLRLYIPELTTTTTTKLPLLLHFHGGGFCFSHAHWFTYHQFYTRLANSIPAIILSPTLPLAPENRLPAAIDVSYDALLCLRSLETDPILEKLHVTPDFNRVFLIGDSTGGNIVHHLSSRVGAESHDLSPVKLAGGILMNPGFVRSTRSKSELELEGKDPFFSLEMLDFLLLAVPEGETKDHPFVSPMGEAAPRMEELKLPPFLLVVSEFDLMRETELEYYEAMKRAGKDVELLKSEGVGHSFYLNKLDIDYNPVTAKRTEELILKIKDFVDRH